MKIPYLVFCFVLASISSFAQKIHFTDPGNKWISDYTWVFKYGSSGEGTTVVSYSKDTIVGSNTYHILGIHGIREDTITKKVFIRNFQDFMEDTVEHLLYDYNWAVGDTVKLYNEYYSMHTTYWVDNIDSTKMDGIWYKVWHFKGGETDLKYHYNIIEGIGCTNGFEYPAYPYQFDHYSYQLVCFTNNGIHNSLVPAVISWALNEWGTDNFDNSGCLTLSVEKKNVNDQVLVFPNPINETSRLVLPDVVSGSFIVYNSIGQTIINTNFQNKKEVLFGDQIKLPGIYFYRVIDNQNQATYSGKFIYR